VAVSDPHASLDRLVMQVLERQALRFTLAETDDEREVGFAIRQQTVVEQGWAGPDRDDFDRRSVIVVGWDGDEAVSTGRLVLPPGPLPTELACALVVEPAGRVVDVGRMAVVRAYQDVRHGAFVALMARLYLEMRARGYEVAAGMMSPRVRGLVRLLGIQVELLGADRLYRGEERAPVRFELTGNTRSLDERWS
jgi:hypothetical protein